MQALKKAILNRRLKNVEMLGEEEEPNMTIQMPQEDEEDVPREYMAQDLENEIDKSVGSGKLAQELEDELGSAGVAKEVGDEIDNMQKRPEQKPVPMKSPAKLEETLPEKIYNADDIGKPGIRGKAAAKIRSAILQRNNKK